MILSQITKSKLIIHEWYCRKKLSWSLIWRHRIYMCKRFIAEIFHKTHVRFDTNFWFNDRNNFDCNAIVFVDSTKTRQQWYNQWQERHKYNQFCVFTFSNRIHDRKNNHWRQSLWFRKWLLFAKIFSQRHWLIRHKLLLFKNIFSNVHEFRIWRRHEKVLRNYSWIEKICNFFFLNINLKHQIF